MQEISEEGRVKVWFFQRTKSSFVCLGQRVGGEGLRNGVRKRDESQILEVHDWQFKESGLYPEGSREPLKNVKLGNLYAPLLIHHCMPATFPVKENVKVISWLSACSEWKWELWPCNNTPTISRLNGDGELLSCLPRRMKLVVAQSLEAKAADLLQKHRSTAMLYMSCDYLLRL